MKLLKASLIVLLSMGLIGLGACNNGNQAANSGNSPAASRSTESPANNPTQSAAQAESGETQTTSSEHAAKPQAGGQVVESGPYHLEFVSEPEANGTHLDFYLQRGDNHEAIPNAKVTAQIQSPDGSQKTQNLTYDAEAKHYTAMLPGTTSGQYQVKITSDIDGKKVNGRFNFSR
jgi:hypothetical protein